MNSALRTPHSAFKGFIQAGGRSSRMGTDKAWLEIEGQPMIERVLAAAQPVVENLSIIINAANPNVARYEKLAEKWDAKLLYDLHDHKGPLGGIHTALSHCEETESAFILACDLPFLTTEFLARLIEIHKAEANTLTFPLDETGRLQPLAGLYSASIFPIVEQMLADHILRVDRLCQQVVTRLVTHEEWARFGNANWLLLNLNSTKEYFDSMKKT